VLSWFDHNCVDLAGLCHVTRRAGEPLERANGAPVGSSVRHRDGNRSTDIHGLAPRAEAGKGHAPLTRLESPAPVADCCDHTGCLDPCTQGAACGLRSGDGQRVARVDPEGTDLHLQPGGPRRWSFPNIIDADYF
jgi:hypothetical protein